MMLPETLPARLYPLAWILGSWCGWGTAPGRHAGADDVPLLIDATFSADGEDVRQSVRVRRASAHAGLDVMADAAAGAAALEPAGDGWVEEGLWRLDVSRPAGDGQETYGEGTLTLTGGRCGGASTWQIVAQGPRIAARARDYEGAREDGERLVEGSRMYGLVGGELMWAEDAARNGGDLAPLVTARLARIEP